MIFAIIRIGTQIALPGIDAASVVAARESAGVGTLYSMIAGGANSSWSIFAMGIGPYINASIIMQLLTIAIPKFEQLSKEGPEGRKKLQSYSRYLTVILALIQGIGLTYTYQNMYVEANMLCCFCCNSGLRFHIRYVAGRTDYSKRDWQWFFHGNLYQHRFRSAYWCS